MPPVTVFVPLMHVQVAPPTVLCDFVFQSGAELSTKQPTAVANAIASLKLPDPLRWVADIELNSLGAARGWLWVQQDIEHAPGHEFRNQIMTRLVTPLSTLLNCIHLTGAGENTHWAFGAFQHIWRMYVASGFTPADLPFRIRRLHSAQTEMATVAWSPERMSTGDELRRDLRSYAGPLIPRLALAFHSFLTLAGLDPTKLVERNLRLQIAISALETFYIAPTEKNYIWSAAIQPRLAEVCEESPATIAEFCESIRAARNDVVHRAGLQDTSIVNPTLNDACAAADRILRSTLCWGVKNQTVIAEAFEADRWPVL